MKKTPGAKVKFLYDYLPIIVFFLFYKFSNHPQPLVLATISMVVTTFIALIICYSLTRTIPVVALISAIILGIFGGLTVVLESEVFIKIKPTAINLIFATILLYGFFTRKPFLSYLLEGQVKMSKEAWLTLSMRWSLFFIFLAILNEIIWRYTSTDFWVDFKVFGMMPLSLVFTISQLPFMMREIKKFEQKK
jgi:intracellular septation protein